jgi:hypothetical protein
MEYEPDHETSDQDNRDKLQLLAAVFRIALFGEDEVPGGSDLVAYGQQGYAFGPEGDVVAAVDTDIYPDNFYAKSDRVHVASLQKGDDVYQFYAVLADKHSSTYLDAYPLSQALYDLKVYADRNRYPSEQPPVEKMVDALWDVSFNGQRLEVYKNLPTKADLEPDITSTIEYFIDLLGALATDDHEAVQRLRDEASDSANRSDIDEIHRLEAAVTDEVDSGELRRLTKLLSEQYFVA